MEDAMPTTLKYADLPDCAECSKRSAGMFCNFLPKTLADFSGIGRPISLPAGTLFMREGYPCDQVYIVCRGQVKLSCSSKEGKTLSLKIARPGEVLGLSAAVSSSNFEMTGQTLVPSVLKVILQKEFLHFLHRYREASWNATNSLAVEYRSAISGVRNLSLSPSVAGRVARLLLDLAE
jgi:CRP/FNR family transcriptional regulator